MDNTPAVQTTNIPIEPIPPPSPRNYLKFIITGLLILFIGLFGGYYLTKSSTSEKPITKQSEKIPQITTVLSSPTPDPTANWKTYSNDKYNFSLSYPPNMKFGPKYEFNSDTRILLSNQLNFVNNNSKCKGWMEVEVVTLGSESISIFEKIANKKATNIKVGDSDGYKLEWVDSFIVADDPEPNRANYTKKITFLNNNYDYSITGYINNNCNNKEDFFKLFDQILSTFKFL